jgi:hypothetical protein
MTLEVHMACSALPQGFMVIEQSVEGIPAKFVVKGLVTVRGKCLLNGRLYVQQCGEWLDIGRYQRTVTQNRFDELYMAWSFTSHHIG